MPSLTPQEAADLAARTLAAIDAYMRNTAPLSEKWCDADRERVVSDLAGFRQSWHPTNVDEPYADRVLHHARYADGLKRTARLYGVEVPS